MKYQPVTCVWEVTMGCNMRCGHCGSSCAEPLPDELNTTEAIALCDQIAGLGLKWITLSGGEPLTRKDIPKIVKRLTDKGVSVNIITNGWMLKDVAGKLKESGVATVAISIDGPEDIHDKIRREGSFARSAEAFSTLKELGIQTGAVTTITKLNIDRLEELKEQLIVMGVDTWQVQLGLPMGNLKQQEDWVLEPAQINQIIDFCYKTAKEGRIRIYPADCIGYYTRKELEIKKISYQTEQVSIWNGCNAGTNGFGILHNGDILGCTSIRSREYVEGNIRERLLRDIWEDENTFLWRRNMTKEQLAGDCRTCRYGSKCLGGCPNTRLTMNGSMESDNQYCAYNLELKSLKDRYAQHSEPDVLLKMADSLVAAGEYQEAASLLERALALNPEQEQAWLSKGYCDYMCGNYEACRDSNQKALERSPANPQAMQGYAIALHKLGNTPEGVRILSDAVKADGYQNQDLLHDLSVLEYHMKNQAQGV